MLSQDAIREQPWAGCPTHRAFCDVWVCVPLLRHESTTIVSSLCVRSGGRSGSRFFWQMGGAGVDARDQKPSGQQVWRWESSHSPTHSQKTRMSGAPGVSLLRHESTTIVSSLCVRSGGRSGSRFVCEWVGAGVDAGDQKPSGQQVWRWESSHSPTDPITRSHPEMLIAYSLVSISVRPTTLSDLAKWAARMDDLVARSEGPVEWGHSRCQ